MLSLTQPEGGGFILSHGGQEVARIIVETVDPADRAAHIVICHGSLRVSLEVFEGDTFEVSADDWTANVVIVSTRSQGLNNPHLRAGIEAPRSVRITRAI